MQILITARRLDVPDSLRIHIEEAVSSLSRYYDGIHDARVTLDGQEAPGPTKRAEVALSVYRRTLRAQETASTHREAVDSCARQLRRQLLRFKDQMRSTKKDVHR